MSFFFLGSRRSRPGKSRPCGTPERSSRNRVFEATRRRVWFGLTPAIAARFDDRLPFGTARTQVRFRPLSGQAELGFAPSSEPPCIGRRRARFLPTRRAAFPASRRDDNTSLRIRPPSLSTTRPLRERDPGQRRATAKARQAKEQRPAPHRPQRARNASSPPELRHLLEAAGARACNVTTSAARSGRTHWQKSGIRKRHTGYPRFRTAHPIPHASLRRGGRSRHRTAVTEPGASARGAIRGGSWALASKHGWLGLSNGWHCPSHSLTSPRAVPLGDPELESVASTST